MSNIKMFKIVQKLAVMHNMSIVKKRQTVCLWMILIISIANDCLQWVHRDICIDHQSASRIELSGLGQNLFNF